jgi:hypothetical protein
MRRILAAFVVAASCAGVASAQPGACDRTCLRSTLDSYLLAVIRHDPKLAPLAPRYRGAENAREVKPGEGFWKTVRMLGSVQRRYLDPVSGQAAYFGIVEDESGPMIASVRIKIEGRRIVEGEWIVGRRGDALYSPAGLAAEPPSERIVPKSRRVGRAALEAAANSYFQGLQQKDGSIVLHNPGCIRLENGTKVTQRRPPANAASAAANEFADNDCAGGFQRFSIREVAHRRFPVIDEEAQVALGTGMFLRPPGSTTRRLLLAEYFVTSGGKIDQIYAAMHYLPAEAPETTGW